MILVLGLRTKLEIVEAGMLENRPFKSQISSLFAKLLSLQKCSHSSGYIQG